MDTEKLQLETALSLTIGEVAEVVPAMALDGQNVCVVGSPGIGKTRVIESSCSKAGFEEFIVDHPVLSEPTDTKGLPGISAGSKYAEFFPFKSHARLLNATRRTLYFIDDLGQATDIMQAAFMRLLEDRMIGDSPIPDCVSIVAATNRRGQGAKVSGMLEPVKGRFSSLVWAVACRKEWSVWACETGLDPSIISYVSWKEEHFNKFVPSPEMVNCPTPRTWHKASNILQGTHTGKLSDKLLSKMVCGAVGPEAGMGYWAFRSIFRDLPNPEKFIADPEGSDIPDSPNVRHALVTLLAQRANLNNYGKIVKFAERLLSVGQGELGSLLVHMGANQQPGIKESKDYARMVSGPLGGLIMAR
jgi:hypothetical protein